MFDVLPFLKHAHLAVDFFFLLSGFVMAHVYGECLSSPAPGAIKAFLRARVARIYPLHLATLAATVAVVAAWPPALRTLSFPLGVLPLSVVMLQAWHYGGTWNYPAWSIGDEALAYVAFVFTARLLLRSRWALPAGVACAVVLTVLCALKGGDLNTISQVPGLARTLAGFSLGVLLYRAWAAKRHVVRQAARLALLPAALFASCFAFDALWIPVFAAAMIVAVEAGGHWRTALNTGPLLWAGNLSLSIYLWHAPVHFALAGVLAQQGIDVATLGRGPSVALTALALALVSALSAASYRWFELPARWLINTRGRPVTQTLTGSRAQLEAAMPTPPVMA